MAGRAPKPCSKAGCHTLTQDKTGRCDLHPKESRWEVSNARGNRHERGYGVAWDRLRIRILTRDAYLCQTCKRQGRLTVASEVDHILGKAQGGTDDPDNLASICRPCHKAKTAAESRVAR